MTALRALPALRALLLPTSGTDVARVAQGIEARALGGDRQHSRNELFVLAIPLRSRCAGDIELDASLHQVNARCFEMMRSDGARMLTLDQCIGMTGLTDDEIAVIAEHRRVPTIVAVEVGHTLLGTAKGKFVLRSYIIDLLAKAKLAGRHEKAKHLDRVLTQFNARYPIPRVLRT